MMGNRLRPSSATDLPVLPRDQKRRRPNWLRSHRERGTSGIREVPGDRVTEQGFVLAIAMAVDPIGIHLFSAVMVPADLEPGDAVDGRGVPEAAIGLDERDRAHRGRE